MPNADRAPPQPPLPQPMAGLNVIRANIERRTARNLNLSVRSMRRFDAMEIATKLAILADAAKYDASCASSGTTKRTSRISGGIGSTTGSGICHSYTPDGRCVSLLENPADELLHLRLPVLHQPGFE